MPCSGGFNQVKQQVLDDEEIIVHPTCSIGEVEVFQLHDRVGAPRVLDNVWWHAEACRNGVCWILFVNAYGPQASRLGLCCTSLTLGC